MSPPSPLLSSRWGPAPPPSGSCKLPTLPSLRLTFLYEVRESTRSQCQCHAGACCCGHCLVLSLSADYFSLLSSSFPSSPLPSPAPSVASSVASSSGSLRHRRPLISPARLNLKGQKLLLFSPPGEAPNTPSSSEEHSPPNGSLFIDPPQLLQRNRTRDTKHTVGTCGPVWAVGTARGALGFWRSSGPVVGAH